MYYGIVTSLLVPVSDCLNKNGSHCSYVSMFGLQERKVFERITMIRKCGLVGSEVDLLEEVHH